MKKNKQCFHVIPTLANEGTLHTFWFQKSKDTTLVLRVIDQIGNFRNAQVLHQGCHKKTRGQMVQECQEWPIFFHFIKWNVP